MHQHVRSPLRAGLESVGAVLAREWSLATVDSQVFAQVASLGESFLANLQYRQRFSRSGAFSKFSSRPHLTRKRLVATMPPQVQLDTSGVQKLFVANVTPKVLHSIVDQPMVGQRLLSLSNSNIQKFQYIEVYGFSSF
jgi:hypothetical protein